MYISNDIDEISICIACPRCKYKSKKDWITCDIEAVLESTTIMSRKSHVYFRCVTCNFITEVFDSNLIKFIQGELVTKDKFDKHID